MALRLPALVQPDPARLGRVLRQLQRRDRLLLQDQPHRRLRPVRGRGRVRGPELLHPHPRRPRDGVHRRRHRKPWLLNLNFTTPHWPWEGPGDQEVSESSRRGSRPANLPSACSSTATAVRSTSTSRWWRTSTARSARSIRALERTGQRHNTLVVFASDNGGERYSYQWPFSGGKLTVLEGGLRVPTIASWPGAIRRHQIDDTPVITYDWSATFLDLAQAEQDPTTRSTGRRLVPHLFSGKTAGRARPLLAAAKRPGAAPRRPQVRPAGRRCRPPLRRRGRSARAGRPGQGASGDLAASEGCLGGDERRPAALPGLRQSAAARRVGRRGKE